jgi:hypothetical protein
MAQLGAHEEGAAGALASSLEHKVTQDPGSLQVLSSFWPFWFFVA